MIRPLDPSRLLLRALKGFITPLTGVDCPIKDIDDHGPLGVEAEEFLTALQKFINSIVHPESRGQEGVSIVLDDTLPNIPPRQQPLRMPAPQNIFIGQISGALDRSTLNQTPVAHENGQPKSLDANASDHSKPIETVLAALRDHVFNIMPIRLLCFEKRHDTDLHISLLERGAIYHHLAEKLKQNFNELEYLAEVELNTPLYKIREKAEEICAGFLVRDCARYAILSHTWMRSSPGEVTYGDWINGEYQADIDHPGFQKLFSFCKVAATDYQCTLGWSDTVCINKESSVELDESIRSMYEWYRKADMCVTYLAETTTIEGMHKDPWFTRGWTLQELLAPYQVKFYGKDWKPFIKSPENDKEKRLIRIQIELATTITGEELQRPRQAPISRRMQWAARREVTRQEDAAYSLMGLFDVSISTAYGEGAERAFFRLVKKILSSSRSSLDVFNWGGQHHPHRESYISGPTDISLLLPPNPQSYLQRSPNVHFTKFGPIEPVTLTHLGLRVQMLLMPGRHTKDTGSPFEPIGKYYATVDIVEPTTGKLFDKLNRQWSKIPTTFNILDRAIQGPEGWLPGENSFQMTFGILNFGGDEANVRIPSNCLAIGLRCATDMRAVMASRRVSKIFTKDPIVFELNSTDPPSENIERENAHHTLHESFYRIQRSQLTEHGMQLLTMYL